MSTQDPRSDRPEQDWVEVSVTSGIAPSGHLRIDTCRFQLPDGTIADWDLVAGYDTVAVLALTSDGSVVTVRQYRPGPGRLLDELPGGYIDDDETPLEAARRELLEETGYAGRLEIIGSTWLAANARIRRFAAVALDCEQIAEPDPDELERVVVHIHSMSSFLRLVRSGEMTDTDIAYRGLDHLRDPLALDRGS